MKIYYSGEGEGGCTSMLCEVQHLESSAIISVEDSIDTQNLFQSISTARYLVMLFESTTSNYYFHSLP